nr:MAG TPA: hypothetical protein [Bacteriophage sp.]
MENKRGNKNQVKRLFGVVPHIQVPPANYMDLARSLTNTPQLIPFKNQYTPYGSLVYTE